MIWGFQGHPHSWQTQQKDGDYQVLPSILSEIQATSKTTFTPPPRPRTIHKCYTVPLQTESGSMLGVWLTLSPSKPMKKASFIRLETRLP